MRVPFDNPMQPCLVIVGRVAGICPVLAMYKTWFDHMAKMAVSHLSELVRLLEWWAGRVHRGGCVGVWRLVWLACEYPTLVFGSWGYDLRM